ncbi:hypothetical protein QYE76_048087 [Lolium multiflorum]|uniref:Retrotransposon gag domain-containing protein n=1 Tax=Lolium multiflorum TaxID=4521 RepID=A0AAD8TT62_LOLMU|nr:hypothetical protein QYE76_048087 [Lolium multiflorum]
MGKPRDTKIAILPSTTRKGTTLSTSAALDSPSVIDKLVSPPHASHAGTSAESENSHNIDNVSAVLDDSGSLGSFLDATIAKSRQIENTETPNENAATPVNSPESVEYSSDDLDEDYVELDDDFIEKCNATTDARKIKKLLAEHAVRYKLSPDPKFATSPINIRDKDYDFSLDLSHIAIVEKTPFCGTEKESAVEHLTELSTLSGVFSDDVKMRTYFVAKIFPFSLKDDAKTWYNNLPPGSIKSPTDLRDVFFRKYFPASAQHAALQRIYNFDQEDGEKLPEAWARFCSLIRAQPDHDLEKHDLLDIFYSGLTIESRAYLDSCAGCVFRKRTPDDAEELLAKIGRNHDDWSTPEPTPTPIVKKRGMIKLNDEDMREAKKSLKEKGIKPEDVKNLPPIEDICETIPPSSMIEYMKDIVTNKRKVPNEEISTMLANYSFNGKIPKKLGDPGTTLSTSAALDSPSVIDKLVSPPHASRAGTSAESENSHNIDNVSAVLDDSGSLGSFLDATIAKSRQIENTETPNENVATPVNSPESVEYSSDDLDEDYVELDDDFIEKCNATTDARKIKKLLAEHAVRYKLSPDPKFATSPINIRDKDYDFSLDLSHIAIVEKTPFCGTEKESVVEHMTELSTLSGLFSDDIKMRTYFVAKFFPFSLKDDAKTWYNNLPPGSIKSPKELLDVFFRKYFPASAQHAALQRIYNFDQEDGEKLPEAWARFCSLIRAQPDHDLEKHDLLDIFYSGLTIESRAYLDSCAGCVFRKRTPDDAEELLAKIGRNHDDWSTPEPTPTPIVKKRGMIKLNDEDMREAKKSLKEKGIKPEDVKNLPPIEDICETIPPSSMIEDPLYPEGHPKRVEQDSQLIKTSAPSKKKKKKHKNVVESSEPVNDPNSISISDAETESGNEHEEDNDKNDTPDKEEIEKEPEKHAKNKKYTKEDFITEKHGNEREPWVQKQMPFPAKKLKSKEEEHYNKFCDWMKPLFLQIPLTDAIKLPPYSKYMKDIVTNKRKVPNEEISTMLANYSFNGKIPKKLGDPGIPTIPCSIKNNYVRTALCDLGAGVSVMPFSLYKRLDLDKLIPTDISLQMADKSTAIPVGLCENVPVQVTQHCLILTDFVVLEMPEDDNMSIILGRPFLNTAGAVIDCNKGMVTFNVDDKEHTVYFPKRIDKDFKFNWSRSDPMVQYKIYNKAVNLSFSVFCAAIGVPQWGSCEKIRGTPRELSDLYTRICNGRSLSNDGGAVIDCNKGMVTFNVDDKEHTVYFPKRIDKKGKMKKFKFGELFKKATTSTGRPSRASTQIRRSYNEDVIAPSFAPEEDHGAPNASSFPCYEFLTNAGILDDFFTLVNRAGLATYVGDERGQYYRLTKVFVESFKFHNTEYEPTVAFKIYDIPVTMKLEEFCCALGIAPVGTARRIDDNPRDLLELYRGITGDDCRTIQRGKIRNIQLPAIKYFAYYIGTSILGRENTSNISSYHLAFLNVALTGETPYHLGSLIARRLSSRGPIFGGTIALRILTHLDIPLDSNDVPLTPRKLDIAAMKSHRFVTTDSTIDNMVYRMLFADGNEKEIPLPQPGLFNIDRQSWSLTKEVVEEHMKIQEFHQQHDSENAEPSYDYTVTYPDVSSSTYMEPGRSSSYYEDTTSWGPWE